MCNIVIYFFSEKMIFLKLYSCYLLQVGIKNGALIECKYLMWGLKY